MAFTKFNTFVCQRAVILQGGRIQGKPKKSCQLFFHEESIHEVSRRYLKGQYGVRPLCVFFGGRRMPNGLLRKMK